MEIRFFRTHSRLVEFIWPPLISEEILKALIKVQQYLEKEYGEGIKEIRKGYHTLSLKLQEEISEEDCQELIEEFKRIPAGPDDYPTKTWTLPVLYGGEYGKDLELLAKIHKLKTEEIIQMHSESVYTIHFYGFLPGFMYLGGLNPNLYTKRKERPERLIQEGTVAIGGQQTGIYPQESPGGWNAIGSCPLPLFDIQKKPPVFAQVGDSIRFKAIDLETYKKIKFQVQNGKYELKHD
ncbi:5-oxoprolinase subunit PxpB [Cecembia rubra]|uniref:5-oxoprolinase subunit PxpB n=1 Tax=Cecembia rubra TaxID=1485585 RepID=UPI0027149D2C|nr:5-oxoprolinase subunit PxpB [Cecembia rubra]